MMLDKEGENINWIRGFRLLVSIAIFFVSVILHGQGEGANWYFGNNAGINFNAGSVNSLSDGGLKTNEGCATISNSKGELLFYTDGITVWDKNHNIMPNGQGLLGDPSSTQSAIIVPKPNSETIYYIFTVINGGRVEGLRYSEVDLTLNNGNGDVSSNKNVLLMTPCTEKISAVKHANGSDYWVATHNWNSSDFTVFKITENGVEMSPVISPGVSFHGGHPYSGIGYMKFSPNGKKIALARWSTDSLVEVFDFDSNTGVISNPIVIDSVFGADFENGAYGIEFSPNSELLYVSEIDLRSYLSKLHQFNLSIYTKTDIINSKVLLYQGRNLISALQLALDGKIYLCRTFTSYLDAIETPNAIGLSSSYISRVVDLQGRRNVYGLPTFIQSLFVAKIEANNLCSNNSSQFSLKTDESVNSVLWDFGDRESSSLKNPNHTYKTSGAYTVEAKINTGYSIISITKDIVVYESPIANKATDYLVCGNVINDGFESFDLNTKTPEILGGQLGSDFEVSYFESHEDATDNIGALPITYTSDINNQVIYARIQNRLNSDCYDISSFLLKVETKLAGLVEDLIICDDKSNDGKEIIDLRQFNAQVASNYPVIPHFNCQITYHLTQAQAISGVLALSNNFETNSNNQDIYARIENTNTGCFDTTHFKIIINETLMAHQPDNMYLCDDASNDSKSFFNLKNQTLKILNTQTGNVTYYLTQSEADAGINPLPENFENQTNPQQLFVRAESVVNASCYDTTSFYIKVNSLPVVGHVDDLTLCDDVSNDGKAIFNLQAQTLNTQTGKVTYHLSQSDADSGLNAIAESFENQTNPQELFIRAESLVNASCYDTASFYIEV
ncbi:PKD domain-containing protein, partial [Algibacter agarivorans]|uniref:PKD domain-containing protein n=1 Tax=Algibacter agarivorans TaxID=1109741 RepID=UPI0031EB0C6B